MLVCASLSGVAAQGNCLITVPAYPLTATGLSTVWIQSATTCLQQPMSMQVAGTPNGFASFVQATIIDLDTGNLYTYTPLIANSPAEVAIQPVVPTLPPNNVVGLFGGSNGNTVELAATLTANANTGGMDSSLESGNCQNGGGPGFTVFGQFFCCNCRQFMDAVYTRLANGFITLAAVGATPLANQIPALGNDVFGNKCPTTHSFAIVDQDQSDNAPAKYLFTTVNMQVAQDTVPNKATLTAAKTKFVEFDNGSDEDLVTLVQAAIGCKPFMLTDMADTTGATVFPSSLSNEIQALLLQGGPRAFVPQNDPMVMNNGVVDVNKLNAYRTAIGQSPLGSAALASTADYCTNLYIVGAPQIAQWLPILVQVPAPDFGLGVSNSLGGLLVGRYGATVGNGNLNCPLLINVPNPFGAFTGVGAGGPLVCPQPNFSPLTCKFIATAAVPTIQAALGVSHLVPNMDGQATFDIPVAPGSWFFT